MISFKAFSDELVKIALKDRIPGGLAKGMRPSEFPRRSMRKGMKSELEHTSSKRIAKEIAMDHLVEDPRYYDKLEKMERE